MMKQTDRRRGAFLALILGLLLPLLAACGGTSTPTGGATAEPAAATSVPAAGAATAPAADATAAPTEAAAAPTVAAEPAAGGATSPAGNVLRIALTAWPGSLDPQKVQISNEIAVLQLNYQGLTALDKDLKTVPAAAESWEYNSDATQISFKLREGLTYSDGSPLRAQDFVNAVYRQLDPRNAGNYQSSLDMIQGADAIIAATTPEQQAQLPQLFEALGVSAPDDRTVVFELSRPTPYFHTIATMWVMYPAKQDLIDAGGEQWYEKAENQIGNGPFQITKIDQGNNLIELKANDKFWGGRPKLDGVQFRVIEDLSVGLQAYKSDEVDIVVPDPNDVPSFANDPVLSKEYTEYAGSCTEMYELNLNRPPFDNIKVRQAFAYALDRDAYIRDALQGTSVKTLTWIPPGYPGYDPTASDIDLNPDKAKQLLAEAGFPDGQGLPEVKISYNSSNAANQARVEYLIQLFQTNLGVTLVPDPVEATTLNDMRKSNETQPQMTGGGWCADYPDPQNWLSLYWHSRTSFAKNFGYANAEVDKLLDEADSTPDQDKRMQLYSQAQKLILADVPGIIRSNNKNFFLVKSYVQGLDFTPQDTDYPGQQTALMNVTIAR